MSYTKRQFVLAAYGQLGMASYAFDLQAEQLQAGLDTLDRMMAQWEADGIGVHYPLPEGPDDSSLDTVTNVYDSSYDAIVLNLSLKIAPMVGKALTRDMKVEAKNAKNALIKFLVTVPQMQYLDTTPKGAGYKTWRSANSSPFYQETCTDTDCE